MIEKKSGSIPEDGVAKELTKIEGKINSIRKEEKGLVLLTIKDKDDGVLNCANSILR